MFKPEEIVRVRNSMKTGQAISITTRVMTGPKDERIIRAEAVIDGVYPNGIMVSFRNFSRYGGQTWLRRWIDYIDILQSRGKKSVYARTGRKEEYYGSGKHKND